MDASTLEHGRGEPVTSLVFPAYNPGAVIDRTWSEVQHFLRSTVGNWEVLFVCDGCTDGTPDRLNELIRDDKDRVRILQYSPNRGKGFAVRHGLAAARGRWRIFTDVDLAYSFEDIVRVAEALRAGSKVVIASRTHPESQMVLPTRLQGYAYRRHLQSMLFSALVRWLLPLTQRDTQAGLKGISADAAQLILPRLTCNGFGFDCDFLTACVRHGLTVKEIPVSVRYDGGASTTSLTTMGRMVGELWRIRRTWRDAAVLPLESPSEPSRRAA